MKEFTQVQLRDYSSLFSRAEVFAWQKRNFYSLNQKIIRYDKELLLEKKYTYKDYLKYVYTILESNYATEYVIKNSFLTDWLIPELNNTKATVFNEFRVGKSVADLAIFNGSSKVFEIKTEFDSDVRLELQLENYKKIFNEVYLIIPETKFSHYNNVDKSVGLIFYNIKKEQKFVLKRISEINYSIDPCAIMNILHTHEYKSIIKEFYGKLPEMTSFSQFEKSKQLILQIPIIDFNILFIKYMKKRVMSTELSTRYFKEFNQLTLALKLGKQQKSNLITNLNTSLTD